MDTRAYRKTGCRRCLGNRGYVGAIDAGAALL